MGLLKHLLLWPVTGPKFLIDFSMGKVEDVVREELTDDARVKSELMELQLQLELGDIDDDEYVRREADLMAQLREIRQWREHFGMGVSGGPVRVQPQPEPAPPVPLAAQHSASDPAAPDQVQAAQSQPAPPSEEETDDRTPKVARSGEATIEFNLGWDE